MGVWYLGFGLTICLVSTKNCFSIIAPIAAVMQFCRADYEAEQLHLSGKRDGRFLKAQRLCFKNIIEKVSIPFVFG